MNEKSESKNEWTRGQSPTHPPINPPIHPFIHAMHPPTHSPTLTQRTDKIRCECLPAQRLPLRGGVGPMRANDRCEAVDVQTHRSADRNELRVRRVIRERVVQQSSR